MVWLPSILVEASSALVKTESIREMLFL
jgi:hypothetical protein